MATRSRFFPAVDEGGPAREWQWSGRSSRGKVLLFLLTAAAYALGSVPAQILLRETGLSAVFFIPAGVTVAFLLRVSKRQWWIVLAAAGITEAIFDLAAGYKPIAIAGFVAANTIEPLTGAFIVRQWCGQVDLARVRHLGWFFVGPVLLACALGAAIGSLVPYVLGESEGPTTFFQWWLGDGLGVLIIGGLILAWGSSADRRTLASGWGALLLAGSALITVATIRTNLPLTFLVLIGIVLGGAVFGTRAVTVTGFVIATSYALEVAFGSGILIPELPDVTALEIIQLRLAVYAAAGLTVAAEAYEGRRSAEKAAQADAIAESRRVQGRLERDVAKRLQLALLPAKPLDHPNVEVAYRYEAGSEGLLVGGDWYDVFALSSDRIGITVGDVAGHGLEAAATMGRLRTAVAVLASHTDSPGELLGYLDGYARSPEGAEFATSCYAVLEADSGRLTYAYAGHPPMLVVAPDGGTRWLSEGRSQPLHSGTVGTRNEGVTQLQPGSLLVAYSDGLVERRGEDLRLGLERLEEKAATLAGLGPAAFCDRLLEEMGIVESRNDDVVLLAVQYLEIPELKGRKTKVDQAMVDRPPDEFFVTVRSQ